MMNDMYVIKNMLSPFQGFINRILLHRALPCVNALRLSALTNQHRN
jgi:hypothetical protein